MDPGGSPTSSPTPARLVVSVGGGSAPLVWPAGDVALDSPGLRRVIDEERAARRVRSEELTGRLTAIDAEATAIAEEVDRYSGARGAADPIHDGRVSASEAVAARRSERLATLRAAIDGLADAVGEWQSILDQHGEAEAALDALASRVHTDETPQFDTVAGEMAEGEAVLRRTEAARRTAVGEALSRVVAAHASADVEEEPLAFAGLLRLRRAIDEARADAAAADAVGQLQQRLRFLERDRSHAEEELAAHERSEPATATYVLAALAAAATVTEGAVVVDEALDFVADDDLAAVLARLPQLFDDRQLIYLTGDVRVLSWAIGLPSHVGGVAGAVDPSIRPE